MDKKVEKDFFRIEKINGIMISGFVLWLAVNIFLYFIGSLLTGSIIMPKYFFFLLLINVIGGAGAFFLYLLDEKDNN